MRKSRIVVIVPRRVVVRKGRIVVIVPRTGSSKKEKNSCDCTSEW